MAQVFSHPSEIDKYIHDMDTFKAKLSNFCKEKSDCEHAGNIIRFQIKDGYAVYMVLDYNRIIHIPESDAYQIHDSHARGLNKDDIISLVDCQKALDELFALHN